MRQNSPGGGGGLRVGLITWRERFPFYLCFHVLPPNCAGLLAVLSTWLFFFFVFAFVISKTLLPEGGWGCVVLGYGCPGGAAGAHAGGVRLPSTCPRLGRRYGVMFDAGSTGSRVHAYQFTFERDGSVTLHHEMFEQSKPGLSSFKGNPAGAAASIDALLQKAVEYVPEGLRSCTPVELKATAGLRLLGAEASQEILNAVDATLRKSPFFVPAADAAIVMDGSDEGPLAWITVNYLLGTLTRPAGGKAQAAAELAAAHRQQRHLPHSAHSVPDVPAHPVAILDMGGASTQIVFMPMTKGNGNGGGGDAASTELLPRDHAYTVELFGKRYDMYQHSHLGYGLKEAGKAIARMAVDKNAFECFPPSASFVLDAGHGVKVSNRNGAVQSYTVCSQYVRRFINKRAQCRRTSCSFNGVYQPKLSQYFTGGEFYVFSYFYDRMEPFLPDDGVVTVGDFKKYGRMVCDSHGKADLTGEEATAQKRNLGTECMDFAFLYEILATGYDMPDTQRLHIKKKINNVETAWCLGAVLKLF